jgi:hypothetical protein
MSAAAIPAHLGLDPSALDGIWPLRMIKNQAAISSVELAEIVPGRAVVAGIQRSGSTLGQPQARCAGFRRYFSRCGGPKLRHRFADIKSAGSGWPQGAPR